MVRQPENVLNRFSGCLFLRLLIKKQGNNKE